MGWPKGKPRPPGVGRKKGSLNKKTNLIHVCEAMGINVFEEMVRLAIQTTNPESRFAKLRDIAPYLYAKKKEVLNLDDHTVEELIETVEKKLEP